LAILAVIAVWWGLKPTAVLDSLGSTVYYWQQCSLAIYEPTAWALLVSLILFIFLFVCFLYFFLEHKRIIKK
jgi:hypothetical protein